MKESFYFPHDNDAHSDPGLVCVFMDVGLAGWGMYWTLIEIMHQQESGKLTEDEFENYIKFYSSRESRGEAFVEQMLNTFMKNKLFHKDDAGLIYSNRVLKNKQYRENLSSLRSLAGKKSAKARANSTSVEQNLTHDEQGKEIKGKEKKSTIVKHTGDFENFWNLYGKKIDKTKCEKVFSHLTKQDIELIFKKLPAYIASTPRIEFRKNPLTWLHGKNWEDEQNPGSVKFFGLLDGYDTEITQKASAKLSEKSTQDEVKIALWKAIIDVESERMTEEQKDEVRKRIKTWRSDNDVSEYQDTPLVTRVKFIEEVKENYP